jgi:hypothetical protein
MKTTIIIQLSRNYLYLENDLLKNIDDSLNKIYKLENIHVSLVEKKPKFQQIYLVSELKYFAIFVWSILPLYIQKIYGSLNNNITNKKDKRTQYNYKFSSEDLKKLKNRSKKCGLKIIDYIRSVILKSIGKLFSDMLILYGNQGKNSILPTLDSSYSIMDINEMVKMMKNIYLVPKMVENFIFLFLNENCQNSFIQLDEIVYKNSELTKFNKSNIRCLAQPFPIQIAYYINEESLDLSLTISCLESHDRCQYLVVEMMKQTNNQ